MLKKVIRRLVRLYKIFILKDKFLLAHKKWVKDNGDETLRLDYKLTKNSVVFDIGGYRGDFAESIYEKYNCTVYVFEPVQEYFEFIKKRFDGNGKIKVFNFGLSDIDTLMKISVSESASSIYNESENKEEIYLKNIMKFITDNNVIKIDLFKINIEGGEFDVLPSIIENGYMSNIADLQIQFHTFVEQSKEKRELIRKDLMKTHILTYDYWFIWENWKKIEK
jgi:FkbM family methyltransferase